MTPRKIRRSAASLLLLPLLAASCAHRDAAAVAPSPAVMSDQKPDRYARPPYLSPTSVDALAILPAPPAPGSEEHRDEVRFLLMLQHDRTPAQAARVAADNTLTVFSFADVLGPRFTPANCPKTARFFDLAEIDEGFFARIGKLHYKRPRPTAEPAIHPVMPQGGYSYPSGHSTRGTLFAELLAYVLPDRRDALIRRGQEIGFGREIAGVHWPSDVLAGRSLGHAIAHAMLASPDARAALDALRPELQRALAPAAAAAAR